MNSKTIIVGSSEIMKARVLKFRNQQKSCWSQSNRRDDLPPRHIRSSSLGIISIADTLREGAKDAIHKIREQGISEIWMLTGDSVLVADRIGMELGIRVEAKLLPEEKVRRVKEWKRKGHVVAMVGDGVNDAPALAAADIALPWAP